jgi:nucleoside-diphosphate-sugar epimerase
MRIHVTGARGFLGSYIVPMLAKQHEVDASDQATLDVTDLGAAVDRFSGRRPDLVVHLAALCGAIPSVREPRRFFEVNAQGGVNVLEACRVTGVPRVLFMSSMTVFGSGEEARTEGSAYAPRHPYAMAKVGAEYASRIYSTTYRLSILVLRPTLVVGEGYKEPHAIGDFVETVQRGEPIRIFGSGDHRRDFVHPEDVASSVVRAADWLAAAPAGAWESVNVANGETPRMRELAELVVRTIGRGSIEYVAKTSQAFSLFASIGRARELLGWVPTVTNEEIIRRLAARGSA